MGFISSQFPSVVHSAVTLFLVCELWTRCIAVNGSIEKNDSHENTPFYDSHNHISEHDHFHEDGFCDCNSQGPWRPLFKPSQAELPDPESLHHLAESLHNSHEQLHEQLHDEVHDLHDQLRDQLHDLPNDLHPDLHSGERQAKKQNHLIHLHLIPHIYVPVMHPVTYSVYENDHKPVTEQTNEFHTTESSASAENHYGDHSPEHDYQLYHQDTHLNLQNQNFPDTNHHHDFAEHSHESAELSNAHNGYYYPQHSAEEHQYQVHEETNRDPFYGNYATGSNDNAHVLPTHKNVNFNAFHKKFAADRSRYNKRFLEFPHNMLRLRVMRPPALGQKNTWLMNYPDTNAFPSKTVFDFKSYPVKAPFFDFKQFMKPNLIQQPLQPIIASSKFVQTPLVTMNKFLQPQVMPINKLLPTPVMVYPTDVKKRMDKVKAKN